MKKLTAMFAALALFFTATAFDPSPSTGFNSPFNLNNSKAVSAENVNKNIRNAFSEKFINATDVSWKENQGVYFAQFKQEGKEFTAAYSPEADFVAICRRVSLEDLPLKVSEALYKKYAEHNITAEATEIVMEGETGYYLTVENKDSFKLLKCDASGNISVLQKTKKKVLVGRVEV
ncbi:MAG: hypothetical protein QM687_01445 [Ferruginibacter sp.]